MPKYSDLSDGDQRKLKDRLIEFFKENKLEGRGGGPLNGWAIKGDENGDAYIYLTARKDLDDRQKKLLEELDIEAMSIVVEQGGQVTFKTKSAENNARPE